MGGAGAGLGCQPRGSLPCLPAWAPGPPGEPGQKPGRAAPEERERRSGRKVQCWGWREKPCPGLAPLQATPFRPATSSRLSFPRVCRPKPLAGSSTPGLCSHPPALSSAGPPPSLTPSRHTGPSGHGPSGHRQGGGPGKHHLSLRGLPRTDAPSRAPTTSCDPGTHTRMHTQCPCVAQTHSAESRAGTVSVSPFSWRSSGAGSSPEEGRLPIFWLRPLSLPLLSATPCLAPRGSPCSPRETQHPRPLSCWSQVTPCPAPRQGLFLGFPARGAHPRSAVQGYTGRGWGWRQDQKRQSGRSLAAGPMTRRSRGCPRGVRVSLTAWGGGRGENSGRGA